MKGKPRPKSVSKSFRFGIGRWELIEDAARYQGISPTQFVREASFAMALLDYVSQDMSQREALQIIMEVVRRDLDPDVRRFVEVRLQRRTETE
jgi:hypothetical protein